MAIPQVLWTDGSQAVPPLKNSCGKGCGVEFFGQIDLKAVRNKCDEVGAWLVIDATQSLGKLPCLNTFRNRDDGLVSTGVVPFSVQSIRPDFMCASVHKCGLGGTG